MRKEAWTVTAAIFTHVAQLLFQHVFESFGELVLVSVSLHHG